MGSSGLMSACPLVDSLRHFMFNEGRALLTGRSTCASYLWGTRSSLWTNTHATLSLASSAGDSERSLSPMTWLAECMSPRSASSAALWNVHSVDRGPHCFRSNCPTNGCAPLCSLRPVKISLSPNTLARLGLQLHGDAGHQGYDEQWHQCS